MINEQIKEHIQSNKAILKAVTAVEELFTAINYSNSSDTLAAWIHKSLTDNEKLVLLSLLYSSTNAFLANLSSTDLRCKDTVKLLTAVSTNLPTPAPDDLPEIIECAAIKIVSKHPTLVQLFFCQIKTYCLSTQFDYLRDEMLKKTEHVDSNAAIEPLKKLIALVEKERDQLLEPEAYIRLMAETEVGMSFI